MSSTVNTSTTSSVDSQTTKQIEEMFQTSVNRGNVEMCLAAIEQARNVGILKTLLEKQIDGKTALFDAFEKDQLDIFEELLSLPETDLTQPCYQNKEGKTLLHLVVSDQSLKPFRILVREKSHELQQIVNIADSSGFTALHDAAKRRSTFLVEVLLQQLNANLSVPFPSGQLELPPRQTLLHYFAMLGDEKMLSVILSSPNLSLNNFNVKDGDGFIPQEVALNYGNFQILGNFLATCKRLKEQEYKTNNKSDLEYMLTKFPSELLLYITFFLDKADLPSFSLVCKQWSNLHASHDFLLRFIRANSLVEIFATPKQLIEFCKNSLSMCDYAKYIKSLDLSCYPELTVKELSLIIDYFPQIQELKLRGNISQEESGLETSFARLPNLKSLSIEDSQISGSCLLNLPFPEQITTICLNKCVLLEEQYLNIFFSQTRNLTNLYLLNAFRLSGSCLLSLNNPEILQTVELGGCLKFQKQHVLSFFQTLKNLKNLSLTELFPLDKDILLALPSLHILQTLTLNNFRELTDKDLNEFSKRLKNVRAISFCGLFVTEKSLEFLPSTYLQKLEIEHCPNINSLGQLAAPITSSIEKIYMLSLDSFCNYERVLKRYHGTEISSKAKRVQSFLSDENIVSQETEKLFWWTFTCSTTGGLAGCSFGLEGIPVGAVAGAIFGMICYLPSLGEIPDQYKDWKSGKSFQEFSPLLMSVHKNQTFFLHKMKPFMCPITGRLLTDPVIDDFGNTYDKNYAWSVVSRTNRDPKGVRQMTTAQLHEDFLMKGLILKAYLEIVRDLMEEIEFIQSINTTKPLNYLIEGLQKIEHNLKKLIHPQYQQAFTWINGSSQPTQVIKEQYEKQIGKLLV